MLTTYLGCHKEEFISDVVHACCQHAESKARENVGVVALSSFINIPFVVDRGEGRSAGEKHPPFSMNVRLFRSTLSLNGRVAEM